MSAFRSLVAREFRLALRSKSEIATQLVFALLVTSLFPLGLGPSPDSLRHLAPGLLVLAVLFTQFLGFDRLFIRDSESGTLDGIAASRLSYLAYALTKLLARWLLYSLPLLLFSPALALLLNMPPEQILPALAALTLASLAITLSGGAAAALTLGAARGFLLPLLLMPLCTPVLIFAAALAANGFDAPAGRQAGFFLGGIVFLYLSLCPPVIAAALKAEVEAA